MSLSLSSRHGICRGLFPCSKIHNTNLTVSNYSGRARRSKMQSTCTDNWSVVWSHHSQILLLFPLSRVLLDLAGRPTGFLMQSSIRPILIAGLHCGYCNGLTGESVLSLVNKMIRIGEWKFTVKIPTAQHPHHLTPVASELCFGVWPHEKKEFSYAHSYVVPSLHSSALL